MTKVIAVCAAGAAALVLAVAASSSGNGDKTLRASLAPSVPTDATFHGVAPGGVPWQLTRGDVRLKEDGELDLELVGLVIPSLGTAGPVTSVSASLFCGPDTNTAPAATTAAVPLSSSGDAEISETIALPSTCLAPIVLVHPNGGTTRYIAVTGWKA